MSTSSLRFVLQWPRLQGSLKVIISDWLVNIVKYSTSWPNNSFRMRKCLLFDWTKRNAMKMVADESDANPFTVSSTCERSKTVVPGALLPCSCHLWFLTNETVLPGLCSVVWNRKSDRYTNRKLRTQCGALPLNSHFKVALCENLPFRPMKNSQNRNKAFGLSEGDKPGREPRTRPVALLIILTFCLRTIFYLFFFLVPVKRH